MVVHRPGAPSTSRRGGLSVPSVLLALVLGSGCEAETLDLLSGEGTRQVTLGSGGFVPGMPMGIGGSGGTGSSSGGAGNGGRPGDMPAGTGGAGGPFPHFPTGTGGMDWGLGGDGAGGGTLPVEAGTGPDASTSGVECTEARQCDGRSPHCDPVTNRCVQCLVPAHCGFPSTCDPVARRCAPPCLSDGDCPLQWGGHCATDRGVCVQCTTDFQCVAPFARFCDTTPGECVGCLADSHCPTEVPVCHSELRQCVQCRDDSRCPAGARCDLREGRCYFGS